MIQEQQLSFSVIKKAAIILLTPLWIAKTTQKEDLPITPVCELP